jgi:hypothetical protein
MSLFSESVEDRLNSFVGINLHRATDRWPWCLERQHGLFLARKAAPTRNELVCESMDKFNNII